MRRRAHLPEEGAVELNDVGTVTAPHHHVQVHQQLLLLLLIHCGPNPLQDKPAEPLRHMVTVNGTGGGARRSGHAHWQTSPTHLDSHNLVTGLVHHLVDGAVGPAADLAQVFQVLGGEVPVLLRDLQLSRRLDAVRPQPLSREKRIRRYGGCSGSASPACDSVTHMCGFWKGGPAVFSVNLVMGLIGGLAKFSFRALRLPVGRRAEGAAGAKT